MKWYFLWPLLLIPNTVLLDAQANHGIQHAPIAITHVAVIDTANLSVQPDMTVIISEDHISAVFKAGEVKISDSGQVVDGRGKFLIPGLWDMHVHVFSAERFPTMSPLLIANGVTGVRDMGTYVPLGTVNGIRRGITKGQHLAPRIFAAGPVVDAQLKDWTNLNVASANEARQAVRSLKKQGADFIKVYDNLSRAEYFAIAEQSRKEGIPFVGHVPWAVSAREASAAGQKSIEHLTGILPACSTEERQIQQQYDQALKEPDFSLANVKGVRADIRAADTFSTKRCAELAGFFRTHHTWQCPTLVEQRATYAYDARSMTTDWHLKYIPKKWRSDWAPETDIFMKHFTAADQAGRVRLYHRLVELAGTLHRGGVDFLVGTDLGRPFIFAGFSLQDELTLFIQAGFTPGEALKTATYNPANFLGMLDRLGTVEKGKLADLVLLDANPLEDIHNTQKIRAVVLNGRYLDRAALDKLLAQAEANAKESRANLPD
jgi:predicted amidohydrolase